MKNWLFFIGLIATSCLAQQKSVLEPDVFHAMDETAAVLLNEAKVNSVSIGIYLYGKTYTKHYGEIDKGKGNKANDNTVFEIASVTKVFTGTLMAKAVLDGKIALDDDVRKYIGYVYKNLEWNRTPIRIKDLITHKTGVFTSFPNYGALLEHRDDSTALKIAGIDKNYSKQQFLSDLKNVKLDAEPGTAYRYTQFGPELSALILEKVYGKSFEMLLDEVILEPAGMQNTKMHPDSGIANGYENGKLMPHLANYIWGAGGFLKSTVNDLLRFMKYELDTNNKTVTESHREIAQGNEGAIGYFWDIRKDSQDEAVYWKHGGAFGTQNMFVVYPKYQIGFSLIVNQNGPDVYNNLMQAIQMLEGDLKPFGQKPIARAIRSKCVENIDLGIAFYSELKKKNPKAYNFGDEGELNRLGYTFLYGGKIAEAIAIFKLYAQEFPKSGNAFDSLAEAYFVHKDYDLSKSNYQKSLALDDKNEHAREMLVQIDDAITKQKSN